MSLQSEGYPEAFSSLDDQLLIILTKETKILKKRMHQFIDITRH